MNQTNNGRKWGNTEEIAIKKKREDIDRNRDRDRETKSSSLQRRDL